MKGIPAYIMKPAIGGDHSNNGFSNRFDVITLLGTPDVPLDGGFLEPTEDRPAVHLKLNIMGDVIAVPAELPPKYKNIGPAFGGCFVHATDDRFREATGIYAAVPLHDRYEPYLR